MKQFLRYPLGLSVIVLLIPVMAVAIPGLFDGSEQTSAIVETAGSQGTTQGIAPTELPPTELDRRSSASSRADATPPTAAVALQGELEDSSTTVAEVDETTISEPSISTAEPNQTSTTSPKTSTTSPKTSTTSPKTTTTEPDNSADDPPSQPVDMTISGSACPCTVTGVAALKGNVSLQGDLVVDGGTLIARPGVKVDGNGYQIVFQRGAKADFQGTKVFTWSGSGSNANLQRDVEFNDMRRIMFMDGAGKSTLKYFEVNNSGTSASDDYPLHWHMNGNSTRGTLVEGVVVNNGKNHAFVPHASNGITFRDTIAKNTKCDAYWYNPPPFQSTSQANNTIDLLYDRALADGVTNCPGDNRGFRLSAFTLGAGSGNTIKNSVARNVNPSHPKDCSGFLWPELNNKQPSSWTFKNNASYGSNCNGIFVWQNDSEIHIVDGFSGDGIDHGAYKNKYDYRNVNVDFVEVHAIGWTVTGGSIDRVDVFKHSLSGNPVVFTNVSIGRFVINNAGNSGTLPATYELNNTGLSCSDIEYGKVVGGTKVVVDGDAC